MRLDRRRPLGNRGELPAMARRQRGERLMDRLRPNLARAYVQL